MAEETVLFVKDLVVEEVPYPGRDTLEYFRMEKLEDIVASADRLIHHEDVPIKKQELPIMNFRFRDDIRICYSKEVEELLGVPIATMIDYKNAFERAGRGIKQLKSELREFQKKEQVIRHLPFLKRLKFLFTGSIDCLENGKEDRRN